MIAFMYRMCHNQALAEELAQEVFLGLSFAQDLCGGSQVYDLALPHRH
jgi:DNA-directed RNA polymerase specialized sigma24 family protein